MSETLGRIGISLPAIAFSRGQTVRGEVVGNSGKGSMLLLNGVLTPTDRRLPIGRQVSGRVDETTKNGQETVLSLDAESVSGGDGAGRQSLIEETWSAGSTGTVDSDTLPTRLGFENTEEGRAQLASMRRFGLPLTPEMAEALRSLLKGHPLGTGEDVSGAGKAADAAAFLLSRRLSSSLLPLLRKYFAGELSMGRLFSSLNAEQRDALKSEWQAGKLFERLIELAKGLSGEDKLPETAAENLTLQEILSLPPQEQNEGKLFFQWPIFWEGQEIPDTLEGEAFYPPRDADDRGFSVRLIVNPPRLGGLEVGMHRLKERLWAHFSPDRPETAELLKASFPALEERLRGQNWREVRLTVGKPANRSSFHALPEIETMVEQNKKKNIRMDLRV
ncbi:MAG: flagellar hook-length control protein FliK [Candidatus Ozemobacteraceae bacterium]